MQTLLAGVTAVLMPSVCEETAGLAAIEQMMRDRLVIVSNIGGLGEVVDDCGLVFPWVTWRGSQRACEPFWSIRKSSSK